MNWKFQSASLPVPPSNMLVIWLSILSSLDAGEVLFIDEIHRLPRAAEELLYIAMEDFRVDATVGKEALELHPFRSTSPRFTVIGATTARGHASLAAACAVRFHGASGFLTRMRSLKS